MAIIEDSSLINGLQKEENKKSTIELEINSKRNNIMWLRDILWCFWFCYLLHWLNLKG